MKGKLLHNNEINKEEWDLLVARSSQGSIFTETWYLDLILKGDWRGILVYDNEALVAVMPIFINRKWGFSYALQPIMMKYWGIVFENRVFANTFKEFSFKKKVINAAIDCIPQNLDYFNYNFHPSFNYPLPFYWKSYQLKTSFTYLLDVRGMNEADIFNRYSPELKNSIRTAQKNEITIKEDTSINALTDVLENNKSTGKIIYQPKHYDTLNRILESGLAIGKCFSLTAMDNMGHPVASSIYIKDNKTVYSLIHIMAKSSSKTDALSLLVHQAIIKSSKLNLSFDFLGSMIEPVEAFNRRFGAQPVSFQTISKKNQLLSLFGK